MALFVMILRKMAKNRWLELSLLGGLILSVALVSSMPVYINAVLQRMLVKDLEIRQQAAGEYQGKLWSAVYLTDEGKPEDGGRLLQEVDSFLAKKQDDFRLPVKEYVRERYTETYRLQPADPMKADPSVERNAALTALSGMEDHIRLVDGRLPSQEPVDGVYETLVTEKTLLKFKMVLGVEFRVTDDKDRTILRIKPVGVFDRKDYADLYWASSMSSYESSFFLPFSLFERDLTEGRKLVLRGGVWYYALDYTKLKLGHIDAFTGAAKDVQGYLAGHFSSNSVSAPALGIIEGYFEKEKRLRLMLWSLNVPVMLMLAFYLYMVANLITERQKTEIAVLRSRGAGRWQIMAGGLIEGLVLGAVALAAGPYAGLLLTKALGASNGFLEFVQRAPLDVELNASAYRYALGTVVGSILMTLIPMFLATRASIVGHKRQMSRLDKPSFWHRYFLDVFLIAFSVYQLQSFRRRMDDLASMGLDSLDFKVDPLLFFVPALFLLGTGLLLLRLYPWFIRAVYWSGRTFWSPALYSTLIQVGRSSTQYLFIMVFLIMTLAMGAFSASAARTINQNSDNQIRYAAGADVTMKTDWENDAPPPAATEAGGEGAAPPAQAPAPAKRIQYTEPPFAPFGELEGVAQTAKVFIKKNAFANAGKTQAGVQLMGIDTDEFGRTAWLRDNLLDHSFYDYLNLIASDPSAVLISRSLAEEANLKPGDTLWVGWAGLEGASFLVYGIIDYWPGWNPNGASLASGGTTAKAGNAKKRDLPKLVVGHLSYIQNNLALEPYEVWLKLKPGTTSAELYRQLEEKELHPVELTDTKQLLIRQKNDPFQLAINGVLTLGFLISILISFFGFLLYWLLSLSARTLQIGILRAMGLSFPQLAGMLAAEQLLTSGAAVLIGLFTGTLASRLFVPIFKISFNTAQQMLPFQVAFDPRDQFQLYLITGAMILIGLVLLGYMLSRIKIHQAVKLGED